MNVNYLPNSNNIASGMRHRLEALNLNEQKLFNFHLRK